MNIDEKPATKAIEWQKVRNRALGLSAASLALPASCAIYTGTSGSTHGDRNERRPARKATAGPNHPSTFTPPQPLHQAAEPAGPLKCYASSNGSSSPPAG